MLRVGEDGCLSPSKESKFALLLPFCSVQALSGLGDAHRVSEVDLLSLPAEMLISFRNALRDTCRTVSLAI